MLSCDLMFLQSLKVINAGAASQGLREGRADSTQHLSDSPAAAPQGLQEPTGLCAGAAALSALWEVKKGKGGGADKARLQ